MTQQYRVQVDGMVPTTGHAPAISWSGNLLLTSVNYVLAWADYPDGNLLSAMSDAAQGQGLTPYVWGQTMAVPNGQSSAGPALASVSGQLWMAWRGANNGIFLALLTESGWVTGAGNQVTAASTDVAPALTAVDRFLIMAWKDANDNTIKFLQSNDTTGLTSPDQVTWSQPPWGSTITDCEYPEISGLTSDTPALAAYPNPTVGPPLMGSQLVCAWKGKSASRTGSDKIYAAMYNALANPGMWRTVPTPNSFQTDIGPAVGYDIDGNVSLAWKGGDGASDYTIWTSTLATATLTPFLTGGETNWTPALAKRVTEQWSGGRIQVAATLGRPALISVVGAPFTSLTLAWAGHRGPPFELWVGPLAGLQTG